MIVSRNELRDEFKGMDLGDDRLNMRFDNILEGFLKYPSHPLSRSFASSAEVKGAYRFFENDKCKAATIRDYHREQTLRRMKTYDEVLVLQDTTFLDYGRHLHKLGLGSIGSKSIKGKSSGLIVHNALATTMEGLPLGLIDQNVWARGKKPDGKESLKWVRAVKKSLNFDFASTKVITVADREADKNAVIKEVVDLEGFYVIRARKSRVSSEHFKRKAIDCLSDLDVIASYEIEVIDRDNVLGRMERRKKRLSTTRRHAKLNVRSATIAMNGIKGKLNAVLVSEDNPPKKSSGIEWFLLTNLPIQSTEEILKIISIYSRRWTIELFHKSLKTGCAVEECRLGDADKIDLYLAMTSVVAWWLLYLQKINRTQADLGADLFFDELELKILFEANKNPASERNIKNAVINLAKLAGFKQFKPDSDAGIYSLWKGWLVLQKSLDLLKKLGGAAACG